MDTHKALMIAVIVLALTHLILSAVVLAKRQTLSDDHLKLFLITSIVVCLLVAALSGYCMYM